MPSHEGVTLVLSGVAQTKRPEVEAAFPAHGYPLREERAEAWWNALLLER